VIVAEEAAPDFCLLLCLLVGDREAGYLVEEVDILLYRENDALISEEGRYC
tara:strand:- start:117 stop:269 length:153 start_codon:yes stop_codon:yes gene_type:complete